MLKRFIPRNVLVLHADDFPNVGTAPLQYGFSVHRSVVVQWEADHDTRVLDWLDTLSVATVQNLAVVQEHNGGIVLRWKAYVPDEFAEGQAVEVLGDSWAIEASIAFADPADE